jgi:Recombination endonuclease VII
MALYIVQGRGAGSSREIWTPGDPRHPNQADSREEVLSSCPRPESLPCPAAGCSNMCHSSPHSYRKGRESYWHWLRPGLCRRCQSLQSHHGMRLTDLIALWEAQGRRCYECSRSLPDPSVISNVRGGGREALIDHDHRTCPQTGHSCKKCRRGLVCVACNTHPLAMRTIGLWVLPEKDEDLDRWLKFLGQEDRARLQAALRDFPGGR